MSLNDTLANTLSKMLNAENIGRSQCRITPASRVIKKVLDIMKEKGYIGGFKEVEDGRGNSIEIQLIGKINKCGVVKPNFSVAKNNFEKFEKRYLPSVGFGVLVVSTSQGMMTHEEAKSKGIGGKLITYVY